MESFLKCGLRLSWRLSVGDIRDGVYIYSLSQHLDQICLDLPRPLACCHNICEFLRSPALLYLEGPVSLVSCIPIGSYNLSALSWALKGGI